MILSGSLLSSYLLFYSSIFASRPPFGIMYFLYLNSHFPKYLIFMTIRGCEKPCSRQNWSRSTQIIYLAWTYISKDETWNANSLNQRSMSLSNPESHNQAPTKIDEFSQVPSL